MRARDAWSTLGIAPTDDLRAVRRAYSARLKTIDVDSDPQAFIDLRAAFEAATRLAEGGSARTRNADETVAEPLAEPVAVHVYGQALPGSWSFEPAATNPPCESPWSQPLDTGAADRAVIEREMQHGASPVDRDAVLAAAQRLLAPDRLERLDVATDTERWFVDMIHFGMPRSDALLAPAINAFGWHRIEHPPMEIEAILDRYRARRFVVDDLVDKDALALLSAHPFVAPTRLERMRRQRAVFALIDRIEADHPSLEHDLDPAALAWWREQRVRPRIARSDWIAIVLVTMLTIVLADTGVQSLPPAAVLPLFVLIGAGVFGLVWLRVDLTRRAPQGWDAPPITPREAIAAAISLALPLAALVLPSDAAARIVLALLAGAATALSGRRTLAYEDDDTAKRRRWSPLLALPLWFCLAIELAQPVYLAGLVPLLCAAVTAHALYYRVEAVLAERGNAARQGVLAGLAIAAVAGLLGVTGVFGPAAVPVAMVSGAILLLVQHVLTSTLRGVGALAGWGIWVAIFVVGRIALAIVDSGESGLTLAHGLVMVVAALTFYRVVRIVADRA